MFKTLEGKISCISIFFIIIMAFIGTISIVNLYNITAAIDGLMINNYKSINMAGKMLECVERQDSAIFIYLNIDSTDGIELFSKNQTGFLKYYNIEENNITELNEGECVKRLNREYMDYIKNFSLLQETKLKYGQTESYKYYRNTVYPSFETIKKTLAEITDINQKAMLLGKETLKNNTSASMYFITFIYIFAVAGCFMLSRYFTRLSLAPVYFLTNAVKKVRDGDLNQKIEVNSNDEIGELACEFNNMTQKLKLFEQSTLGIVMAEKNRSLAIVKSLADPLIVLDKNFKILLTNNSCEEFFDFKESDFVNKYFLEAVRSSEVYDHILDTFNAENSESMGKILIFKKNAREFFFNIIVTKVRDTEKNIIGAVVIFNNVTDFKELEKMKTDFIYGISHEFKTPLTSIMMGASLLTDDNLGVLNERQNKIVESIKEDGERLAELVTGLLELSKIESGKDIFKFTPCNINNIIMDSLNNFKSQIDNKKIKVETYLNRDIPSLNLDYEKILCAFNNIFSNAIKYNQMGGLIIVKSQQVLNYIEISVKDTGIGIAEENRDKIFEKFFHVAMNDDSRPGSGIGLAITKEIVISHGGMIKCSSEVNRGSEFIILLPLKAAM
ncbi:MAG: ATP-binding protein [Candidatus Wallbacteria bacterium]